MHVELTPEEHRVQFMTVSAVSTRDFETGCDAAFVQHALEPGILHKVSCKILPQTAYNISLLGRLGGSMPRTAEPSPPPPPSSGNDADDGKMLSSFLAFVLGVIVGGIGCSCAAWQKRGVPLLPSSTMGKRSDAMGGHEMRSDHQDAL